MGEQQSKEEQQGLVHGYTTGENVQNRGPVNRAPAHHRVPHRRALHSYPNQFDSSGESDAHSSSSSSGRRPRQKIPHSNVNFRERRNPSNRIGSQSTYMSQFSSSVPDIAGTDFPADWSQTRDATLNRKMAGHVLSQSVYSGLNENGHTRTSSSSSGKEETFSQSTQNLNSSKQSHLQPNQSIFKKLEDNTSGLQSSQQVFSSTWSQSNNSVIHVPNEQQSRPSDNTSRNDPFNPSLQSRHTSNLQRNFPQHPDAQPTKRLSGDVDYHPSSQFGENFLGDPASFPRHMENSSGFFPYQNSSQSKHMDYSQRDTTEPSAFGVANQLNIREAWIQFQQMQYSLQQLQASGSQILQEMDNEQRENEEWVSVIGKKANGIENRLQRMEDKAIEDEQTLNQLENLLKTLCNKFDDLEIMVKTMSGQEKQTDTTVKTMLGPERDIDEKQEPLPASLDIPTENSSLNAEGENNEVKMIDLSTLPNINKDRKGYKDRQTERRQDNRRQMRKERKRNDRTMRSGQDGATRQSVQKNDKKEIIPKTTAQKIPQRPAASNSSHTDQRLPLRVDSVSDAESTDSRDEYRNLTVLASGKRVLSTIEQEIIPNSELHWRSLFEREKQAARRSTLPKGNGSESFLVLDTSDSMRGQPFAKMIQCAKAFINGVLNNAELTDESICIVEVGQTTRVLVHLTNDRDKLLSALGQLRPGGMSPIIGALVLVQDLLTKGNSNVIVISDGKMTPIHIKSGQDLPDLNNEHQKVQLVLLTENMRKHNAKVFFVPVGPYDSSFMEGIVKATGGDEIEPDKIHRICNWTRNAILSLEMAKEIKKQHPGVPLSGESFKSVIEQLGSNITSEDIVMGTSDGSIIVTGVRSMKKNNNDQELEDMVKIATEAEDSTCGYIECDPNMPPIGTRVRRGPDWRWGNQDIEMAGTVVSHTKNGHIWVEWDYGNIYRYRCGADGCFDVVTAEDSRQLEGGQMIAVGCVVKRGPDWQHSHTENSGSIGVVYIVHDDGTVQVRWSNGKMSKHKFGQNGCYEVETCDPLQQRLHLESAGASGGNPIGTQFSSKDTTKDDDIDPIVAEMNRKNAERSKQKSEVLSRDKQQDGSRDNRRISKSSSEKNPESANHDSTKISSEGHSQTSQSRLQDSDNRLTKPKDKEVPSSRRTQPTLNLVPKKEDVEKTITAGTNGNAKPDIVIPLKGQGIWQYKDGYGGWKSYDKEHNDKLEKGYCHHPAGASLLYIGKSSYRILFSKFKQVNTKTKEMIDIRRLVPQS